MVLRRWWFTETNLGMLMTRDKCRLRYCSYTPMVEEGVQEWIDIPRYPIVDPKDVGGEVHSKDSRMDVWSTPQLGVHIRHSCGNSAQT
jgi:hypothetical protein